jgi:hypothetical protein
MQRVPVIAGLYFSPDVFVIRSTIRADEGRPPEIYPMIVACENFKKNNPIHNLVGISCFLLLNLMGMSPVRHRNIIGTYAGSVL